MNVLNTVNSLRIGTDKVDTVYLGVDQLWERTYYFYASVGDGILHNDTSGSNIYITHTLGDSNEEPLLYYSGSYSSRSTSRYNNNGTLNYQYHYQPGSRSASYAYLSLPTLLSNDDAIIGTDSRVANFGNDTFICRTAKSDGSILWSRQINATTYVDDVYGGAARDSSDNVYVCISSDFRVVVMKLNSSGSVQWQRKYQPNDADPDYGNEYPYLIQYSASDDTMVVCGLEYPVPNYYNTVFIAKISTSGTLLWWKRFDQYYPQGLAVADDGSILITYTGWNTPYDFHLMKLNSSGVTQWSRKVNRSGDTLMYTGAIDSDSSGNVYVCGGEKNRLTGKGLSNHFWMKFNSSGTLLIQREIAYTDPCWGSDAQSSLFESSKGSGSITMSTVYHKYDSSKPYSYDDYRYVLLTRLPKDGSLTGTTLNLSAGLTATYRASSYTVSNPGHVAASTAVTTSVSSLVTSSNTMTQFNVVDPITTTVIA
jgi:hypothetical protein